MRSDVVLALALAAGCAKSPEPPPTWQGIVEFEERVLAFEVPGKVQAISVTEGDIVGAGDEIAKLDDALERLARDAKAAEARAVRADLELIEAGSRPEDIRSRRAELASARAQEALAKQSLTRVQSLQKSGVASASDLDDAEATHASAVAHRRDVEAQLGRLRRGAREQEISAAQARAEAAEMAVRSADERIARHSLRAGAAATVLDVHLETDEFAAIGMPVVTLADLHHPYVDVFIPQADIDRISLGQSLTVNVDARDESYPAKVEHIARRTEFTPRFLFSPRERPNLVIRVRVRVDAPDGDLPAGVPAFVKP